MDEGRQSTQVRLKESQTRRAFFSAPPARACACQATYPSLSIIAANLSLCTLSQGQDANCFKNCPSMLRYGIPVVLQVIGTTEATKNYEQSHTYALQKSWRSEQKPAIASTITYLHPTVTPILISVYRTCGSTSPCAPKEMLK
jgi:hypothetical protein